MSTRVKVYPDTYLDSVLQLSGTRSMFEVEGVEWAAAAKSGCDSSATCAGAVVATPTTSSSPSARSMRARAVSRSGAHTTSLPRRLS